MQRSDLAVKDRELERQGRRMVHPALRLMGIAATIAVVGIVVLVIGASWSLGIGLALLLLASIPAVLGVGLLTSSAVARWAARHKLFA
jgi:hypothetical protein